MNRLNVALNIILVAIFIFIMFSCTDLTEQVHSEYTSDKFYQNEEQVVSAMAPAYSSLRNLVDSRGILAFEEMSTDIMAMVTRTYGGWYDGGFAQKYHEHTWTPETNFLNGWWNTAFNWVNQANRLIYQFDQIDNMDPEPLCNLVSVKIDSR